MKDKVLNQLKAQELLNSTSLLPSEKLQIQNVFAKTFKDDYPFIKRDVEYFHSMYKEIESLMFKTENEVILANSIFINLPTFSHDEFLMLLKATFRLLQIDSEWI